MPEHSERFREVYAGLLVGLGLSIRNGLKGWANIYLGNEKYWGHVFSLIIGPMILLGLVLAAVWVRLRPPAKDYGGEVFPHSCRIIWLVLITQNVIAQLVTGPLTAWTETVFSIYYVCFFSLPP